MNTKYGDFVNYELLDPFKELAARIFEPTLSFPERLGIRIVRETVGEPSVAYDFSGVPDSDWLLVSNIEGLGTKSRIADRLRAQEISDKANVARSFHGNTGYRSLGKDAIAASLNDQVAIGADVFAYSDIISSGNSSWLSEDPVAVEHLLTGYRLAAEEARLAIPQGETPTLPDVVERNAIDLAGSTLGLIRPKASLITGNDIQSGDWIYGLSSSGPHTNGITKIRKIVEMSDDYSHVLPNRRTVGEAILEPTVFYSGPVLRLLSLECDLHYLQPLTGHGWAKIARARQRFRYRIEVVPPESELFSYLKDTGNRLGFDMSDRENYYTWNMGIGFVIIAPKEIEGILADACESFDIAMYVLGEVVPGDREVVMPFSDSNGQVIYRA